MFKTLHIGTYNNILCIYAIFLQKVLIKNILFFLADWLWKCEEGKSDKYNVDNSIAITKRLVDKHLSSHEKQLSNKLSTEEKDVFLSWIIMDKLKVKLVDSSLWSHFIGQSCK